MTKNRIFEVNNCRESSSAIIMGYFIVNNVTKGDGQIYVRVLYLIHHHHEVFDNDFQLHRLNAPKSLGDHIESRKEFGFISFNSCWREVELGPRSEFGFPSLYTC